MKPPRVSSSRYVPERTGNKFDVCYICSECGVREATDGFFWAAKPGAIKPPNQSGFEPW
jgi:hypothetical protein